MKCTLEVSASHRITERHLKLMHVYAHHAHHACLCTPTPFISLQHGADINRSHTLNFLIEKKNLGGWVVRILTSWSNAMIKM